jgi:rare lipoprotein A
MTRLSAAALGAALAITAGPAWAEPQPVDPSAMQEARKLAEQPPVAEPPGHRPPIDHSGRKQKGKASFYGEAFRGRKMANGRRFNPDAEVAASKSLPLGTVAKVTSLKTGKSATVRVEDRGPYVDGRVVDVTPKTAAKLGMVGDGVAPVVVAPVAVPQRNGDVKAGAGAAEVPPTVAAQALRDADAGAGGPAEAVR